MITSRSLKFITMLTAVQKVKMVITGRSPKVITVLTAIQNVTIKLPCWEETPLIAKVKENVSIES